MPLFGVQSALAWLIVGCSCERMNMGVQWQGVEIVYQKGIGTKK